MPLPHHRFDDLDPDALRRRGGLKWTKFPDHLGAFVAEMDFGTAPVVADAVHRCVTDGLLGYLPSGLADRLGEAFAGFAARRFGWRVDPARVRPVGDVVAGLRSTLEVLTPAGSPVIVPTPAYMPFLTAIPAWGRRVLQVPMAEQDGRAVYDLDALDAAFRAGGHLLVLCNPHNPVGRVLERDELVALAQVVERHRGRVFADEVHAPLVYDGAQHVPYASVSETTAQHTVTAVSASKAWNVPGLKCAQLVLTADADAARWAALDGAEEHGASAPGVAANTAAYAEGEPWLEEVLDYLDGSRRLLGELLAAHLPEVGYRPPEGTYLAWLDCRRLGLGDHPGDFFHAQAGVAVTDGPLCGRGGEGFVRYNLATPRPLVERAVAAMADAVRRTPATRRTPPTRLERPAPPRRAGSNAPLDAEEHVLTLEQRLLSAATRSSPGELQELLDPELREVGEAGRVRGREEVLAALAADRRDVAHEQMTARVLAVGLVQVEYLSDPAGRPTWRTSLWRRDGTGRWRLLHRQDTLTEA